MDLFGSAYLDIRNKYVIPTIKYGVKRKKYSTWNIKKTLIHKIQGMYFNNSTYEIELNEDDFYNSLICDVELFYNKTLLQLKEYNKYKSTGTTWSIVTLYYFLFFSATTLLRILHRGYIFLDSSITKELDKYYTAVYSSPIQLKRGSYYFYVKPSQNAGKILVCLTHKSEGVHQLTLYRIADIIRQEIMPKADPNEKVYFEYLNKFLNIYDVEFPSTLRNQLNYTNESCVLDIEKKIPIIDFATVNNNILRSLTNFKADFDTSSKITCTAYYASILFNYTYQLHKEYSTRSVHGKDFQSERANFLPLNSMIFK